MFNLRRELILVALMVSVFGYSQNLSKDTFGKGLTITAEDSSFYMKFGLRFQTRYVGKKNLETNTYSDNLVTRRARLKFDGFAFDSRLKFKVQLALSNRDDVGGQIPESGNTANIVLDAVLKWSLANNWSVWFGQTKLPSSREFAIPSQKLQFVERSLVHSNFNWDRDRGIQLHHTSGTDFVFKQSFAITFGEGKNIIVDNPANGYQVSGRLEFLPLGSFIGGGDNFMSDLKRETSPKISIGIAGNINSNAVRQKGTLGAFLTDPSGDYITNDLKSIFADVIIKYNGWSVLSEYASRNTSQTNNGFWTGNGIFAQVGYLLPSNWEFAGRLSEVSGNFNSPLNRVSEFTFGVSRFVVGHNLRIQSDISYQNIQSSDNKLIFRFQTDLTF